MVGTLEETYGQLLLSQLFTHIWFGNWDEYERTITQLPEELKGEFPFHQHYHREDTEMWHDNYFNVPGIYYTPPYISSYSGETEAEQDESRHDLLCLVGTFDTLGFYYPLEQEEFPDHFGSLTAFVTASVSEEIKAMKAKDDELADQLRKAKEEMYVVYIKPNVKKLWQRNKRKVIDSFFKEFIPYYMDSMEEMFNN